MTAADTPDPSDPGPSDPSAGDGSAPDAAAVAAAVLAVSGVVAMSAGPVGQFRSYLPGGTVPGVRIDDGEVIVNVVARYGMSLTDLGEQVRRAVGSLVDGRSVTVSVDDVVLPGDDEPDRADDVVEPYDLPAARGAR